MGTASILLTHEEIADMCAGLQSKAAQCRFLSSLGLHVERKPNGEPLVARSEFERVLGAARLQSANDARPAPNVVNLMEHLAKRRARGTKA